MIFVLIMIIAFLVMRFKEKTSIGISAIVAIGSSIALLSVFALFLPIFAVPKTTIFDIKKENGRYYEIHDGNDVSLIIKTDDNNGVLVNCDAEKVIFRDGDQPEAKITRSSLDWGKTRDIIFLPIWENDAWEASSPIHKIVITTPAE